MNLGETDQGMTEVPSATGWAEWLAMSRAIF